MVVGIYYGGKKPVLNEYIAPFVEELEQIIPSGINIGGYHVEIKFGLIICDTPARCLMKGECSQFCISFEKFIPSRFISFQKYWQIRRVLLIIRINVPGVVSFNHRHGCQKCKVIGDNCNRFRVMSFPDLDAERRTDASFRSRSDANHHKQSSLLERLDIDMITTFTTSDTLHLLDLGVMRRCMFRWVFGAKDYKNKWTQNKINQVSALLENCKAHMPVEIHRKIRSLDCLRKWKGLELRTVLIYVGMIVFKPVLDLNEYNHFIVLCCAVRICTSKLYKCFHSTAEKMFRWYVQKYEKYYGRHSIGSNVHLLSHIVEDMRIHQIENIMDISTYKYENCLRLVGLHLRHGHLPLEQASRRLSEISQLPNNYDLNQMFEKKPFSPQVYRQRGSNGMNTDLYEKIEIAPNVTLSCQKTSDSWFITNANEIVKALKIRKEDGEISIEGVCILTKSNFFTNPISSSELKIFSSDGRLSDESFVYRLNSIIGKMICLPYQNESVFIPLEHSMDVLAVN